MRTHASMELTFEAGGPNSALKGVIDYSLRKRKRAFKLEQLNLLSVCGLHTFATFDALGPFTAKHVLVQSPSASEALRRLSRASARHQASKNDGPAGSWCTAMGSE